MSEPTYHEPTFRTWPPEPASDGNGRGILMQRCEELVDGHWEAFYSVVGREPVDADEELANEMSWHGSAQPLRSTGPCPCECNRGGFCGGCGHAGCGGRR